MVGHQVKRIGDHDDHRMLGVFLDALGDGADDFGILRQEVFAGHSGLARQTGGMNDNVRAFEFGEVIGAANADIVAAHRTGLKQIQRLSLWQTFNDVEDGDVANVVFGKILRDCRADVTCSDDRYFFSHNILPKDSPCPLRRVMIEHLRSGIEHDCNSAIISIFTD